MGRTKGDAQMKMTKKQRDKWVKALRSGEYGQTKGVLTDGIGGLCCLGVLEHCLSGGKVETYESHPEDWKAMPSPDWYKSKGIEGFGGPVETNLTAMNDGQYIT